MLKATTASRVLHRSAMAPTCAGRRRADPACIAQPASATRPKPCSIAFTRTGRPGTGGGVLPSKWPPPRRLDTELEGRLAARRRRPRRAIGWPGRAGRRRPRCRRRAPCSTSSPGTSNWNEGAARKRLLQLIQAQGLEDVGASGSVGCRRCCTPSRERDPPRPIFPLAGAILPAPNCHSHFRAAYLSTWSATPSAPGGSAPIQPMEARRPPIWSRSARRDRRHRGVGRRPVQHRPAARRFD